ncbi:MAG TPA: hypothetical protein PK970_12180 [Hyphomicrobiaceae bacterium]|nr:hypothetical protein [Hyphomicrobiaceae bacterium]
MTTTSLIVALVTPIVGALLIGLWYAKRGMSGPISDGDTQSVGLPQSVEDAVHLKNDLARGRKMVEDYHGGHDHTGDGSSDGGSGD